MLIEGDGTVSLRIFMSKYFLQSQHHTFTTSYHKQYPLFFEIGRDLQVIIILKKVVHKNMAAAAPVHLSPEIVCEE